MNIQDQRGYVALHWSAYKGFENMVKLLIKNGADINICNEAGSALYEAVSQGSLKEIFVKTSLHSIDF